MIDYRFLKFNSLKYFCFNWISGNRKIWLFVKPALNIHKLAYSYAIPAQNETWCFKHHNRNISSNRLLLSANTPLTRCEFVSAQHFLKVSQRKIFNPYRRENVQNLEIRIQLPIIELKVIKCDQKKVIDCWYATHVCLATGWKMQVVSFSFPYFRSINCARFVPINSGGIIKKSGSLQNSVR